MKFHPLSPSPSATQSRSSVSVACRAVTEFSIFDLVVSVLSHFIRLHQIEEVHKERFAAADRSTRDNKKIIEFERTATSDSPRTPAISLHFTFTARGSSRGNYRPLCIGLRPICIERVTFGQIYSYNLIKMCAIITGATRRWGAFPSAGSS